MCSGWFSAWSRWWSCIWRWRRRERWRRSVPRLSSHRRHTHSELLQRPFCSDDVHMTRIRTIWSSTSILRSGCGWNVWWVILCASLLPHQIPAVHIQCEDQKNEKPIRHREFVVFERDSLAILLWYTFLLLVLLLVVLLASSPSACSLYTYDIFLSRSSCFFEYVFVYSMCALLHDKTRKREQNRCCNIADKQCCKGCRANWNQREHPTALREEKKKRQQVLEERMEEGERNRQKQQQKKKKTS